MAKTLSFAAMHMTVAFTVVYLLTGDVMAGGLVALVEPMCNTVAYHFHEKLWSRSRRGNMIMEGASTPPDWRQAHC